MHTVRAIQTRYAGCHFRSRLEARWAVLFDTLGIPWEYEPQGFELPWRLSGVDGTIRYLPDFWLPQHKVWAEVKGDWDGEQCGEFLNAAAALSAPRGGCGDGNDVVLLGPIPARHPWGPYSLHLHKGDLFASAWLTGKSRCEGHLIADDGGGSAPLDQLAKGLLAGSRHSDFGSRYLSAVYAARSARFEHGRSGAT